MRVIVNAESMMAMSHDSNNRAWRDGRVTQEELKAKVLATQLQGVGLKAFLCPGHANGISIFEEHRHAAEYEIYPVLLNASNYSRDMQQLGMVRFAWKQFRQLGIKNLLGIITIGIRHPRPILMRDFRYASMLLAAMEIAKFKMFHPRVVFLHPQITDLALANGNKDFFKLFANFVRGKYRAEAGLITNNLGFLLEKLEDWDIDVTHVVGPVNRQGYHMKPDQQRCEKLILNTNRVVVATEVTPSAIPSEDDLEYLRRLNISSLVVQLDNIPDAIKLIESIEQKQNDRKCVNG